MTLRVKYFGVIAEETGKTEELIELDQQEISLEDFRALCFSKYSFSESESIRFAVNQVLDSEAPLVHRDEIALLPPFAGG